jgi:hypothetical protein
MAIFLLRLKFCHDFSQVPDGHGKWLLTVLYPVRIESRADGGNIACPACGNAVFSGWGYARARRIAGMTDPCGHVRA